METYNMIDETPYPVDTPEEVESARRAMQEVHVREAIVYAGAPDDPESYETKGKVFA